MPSLRLLTTGEAARQFPWLRPFTADPPIHYLGAWRSAAPRHPDSPAIAHDPRWPAWVSASLSTQGQRPRLRVVWHFSPPAATEVESYYREIAPHLPGQVAAALDRAAIGLLLADLWRKEDECGLREIWDF